MGDVQIQALGELILSRIAAIAAEGYHIFRFVGNDIDYTADGIRTIKGRSGSVQHLDALDAGHVLRPLTNISTCLLESPFIIR